MLPHQGAHRGNRRIMHGGSFSGDDHRHTWVIRVFERGFVTYSNAAKIECLGVSPRILEEFGAVSREAALAMAEGALAYSSADLTLSITGIAGPGGGSPEKLIGLVHFGFARRGAAAAAVEKRFGDLGRDGVRSAAIAVAIKLLLEAAG